jgi:Dolichyl-phosphate-mannose-protein mannosyltransferase
MLPALSQRVRWALVVAAGMLLLVAIDVWWVATYRHGYPLDIDEAGYTLIGFVDYLGLRGGGLHGWWEAIQNQAPNAPLVPAVTSLLLVVKAGVLEGFATLIGFLVLLVFAIYGLAERLAGPRLGALAALVVATSPGCFLFAREYIFALPVAALLACAVYALLRSEGLRVRRWAIGCGAALGLMLLARTMAVAFVPGVLAAAVVALVTRERNSTRRGLANLGLLLGTGVAVSATWYAHNLQSVINYLTGYGYGAQSSQYGASHAVISWGRFRAVAERITVDDLLVPLAVLMLAGLVAVAVATIKRVVEADDRRTTLAKLARSDALGVAIVFAAGYAALMSSQNGGNGFTFPLTVLLPPLAVLALSVYRVAVVPAVAALAAIAALNVAATSDIWEGLSRNRLVSVPGFGALPWLNGVPHAVGGIRVQVPGPETRFDNRDRGWPRADEGLAQFLVEKVGTPTTTPVVAFASHNRVLNTNTVELAGILRFHRSIPLTLLSAEGGDTVAAYARQLSDPQFGLPTVLVTMDRNTGDFPPLVTQAYAETAARRLHFRVIHTMRLPDGRLVRVWLQQLPKNRAATGGG